MGQADNTQDEFSAKISDAVDDMFNPVRRIEIDPATNEVIELDVPTLPLKEGAVSSSAGTATEVTATKGSASDKQETLAKLDQSLMTLDWEVSRSNVGNMRDLLDQAVQEYDLGAFASDGGMVALMHKLLYRMNESPENVPTSGPLALKNSLIALKAAAVEGQPFSADTRIKIEKAQAALVAVLPEDTISIAMPPPEVAVAPVQLPEPLDTALNHHLRCLDGLLKQRLSPVETFFGNAPSMSKLYTIIKGVNEQLSQQRTSMKQILAGSVPSVVAVNDLVPVAIDISKESQAVLQYHLQVLDHCSRRIAPIENLFNNMAGQNKLHAIHYEVRCGLVDQKNYLMAILSGDDVEPPVPAKMKIAAAPQKEDCPWSMLVASTWQGQRVAFIPEQVCFDGKPGLFSGKLEKMISFKLQKLKSWPWSGLQSRFRGDLAEKSNGELARLEFPVVNFSDAGDGRCGKNVVVLFSEAKGAVLFTGVALTNVSVAADFSWIPERRKDGIVAGSLDDGSGEMISVVDLNRL